MDSCEKEFESAGQEARRLAIAFLQRTVVTKEIIIVDYQTIQNLFAMTPYYWKTGAEGSEHLRQTQQLDTQIEFHFLVYQRNP